MIVVKNPFDVSSKILTMQSEEIEFRKLLGFFISFFPISPNSIYYCYFEYRFVSSIRIQHQYGKLNWELHWVNQFLFEFFIHFNLLKAASDPILSRVIRPGLCSLGQNILNFGFSFLQEKRVVISKHFLSLFTPMLYITWK